MAGPALVRVQEGFNVGVPVPCTAADGVGTAVAIAPVMALIDGTGNALGSASNPLTTTGGGVSAQSYTLTAGANSSGAVTPTPSGYALNLPNNFNGATISVAFTVNGTTYTSSFTSQPATPPIFNIYANTSVVATVTGGAPSGNTVLNGGPAAIASGGATDASVQQVVGNTKPVTNFVALTVAGAAVAAGIGIACVCTAAGNAVLQAANGSKITVPLVVGFNQFGFAITQVVSQTATATYTNLY